MTRRDAVAFLGAAAVAAATVVGAVAASATGRLAIDAPGDVGVWVPAIAVLGVAASFATALATRRSWHRPIDAEQPLHVPCEPNALFGDVRDDGKVTAVASADARIQSAAGGSTRRRAPVATRRPRADCDADSADRDADRAHRDADRAARDGDAADRDSDDGLVDHLRPDPSFHGSASEERD